MTALTAPTARTHAPFRGKLLGSARLHFANVRVGVLVPLGILGVILVANVGLLVIVLSQLAPEDRADAQDGLQYSGAAFYFIVYMMVFGVQAMTVTFPFALGWGVSRRDYYAGTLLAIVVRSLGFGTIFTVLSLVESSTGGWFVGGRMFTAVYFPTGDWWVRLLGFTVLFLFAMVLGSSIATVWVRWRGLGMLVLWGGLGLLGLVAVSVITFAHLWGEGGGAVAWLVSQPEPALWALLLVPSVVLAGLGYLVLRRATPRS